MAETEFRQGAVPRSLPARPDPPHPRGRIEAAARGEDFLARLRTFCENEVDPTLIERDGAVPDRVFTGLAELGALDMKIDTEYGGLGLSQVDYHRALMLAGSAHPAFATLLSAHNRSARRTGAARPADQCTFEGSTEIMHLLIAREAVDAHLTVDDNDRRTARHALDGRYTWLEDGILDPSIPGPWIEEPTTDPASTPNL